MKGKGISLILAITAIVLILNTIIVSIFLGFNQYSYDFLAKNQSDRLLSILYERTELYFHELLSDATLFNELFCDQVMYDKSFLEEDLTGIERYSKYITEKVKERYTQIGVVSYGDEQGRYLGFRINPDRTVNLMLKDSRNNNKLTIYSSDNMDSEILLEYDEYSPQDRPWYIPAKKNPVTQWSEVYVNYDDVMDLAISVLTPVFNDEDFYGVITSDVSLNVINEYLKNDKEIGNGVIYIVDKDNNILLHSDNRDYINVLKTVPPTYDFMKAMDVENPIISLSMNYVLDNNIDDEVFSFKINNESYFGYTGSLDRLNDLGFRAIIAIPERDLLHGVKSQQFQSLVTVMIVVFFSVLLGIWLLAKIIRPIVKVTSAAKDLSEGDFSISLDKGNFQIHETYELTEAFNNMTLELKGAFFKIKENEFMLERKINEKTIELQKTYDELLEKEKLASLGGLVAGIAHEINTPLGVAVSACSYLKEQNTRLFESLESGKLSKDLFVKYLETTDESIDIMDTNLIRAAQLISSFKQISVDQTDSVLTNFLLKEYFESIFLALKHEYKNKDFKYNINCDESLEIYSYPGAISQIFTNLILNSLKHGFRNNEMLNIDINVKIDDSWVIIVYKDNGIGIPEENIKHIFEPFFTTKRKDGGSGLGLSIVYNIVTSTLEGTISCESKINQGVLFTIMIPKSIQKGNYR